MKGSWKVFLFIVVAAAAACGKEAYDRKSARIKGKERTPDDLQHAIYASEWQTLDRWDKDDKGFYAQRQLPVKTDGGKVLVFARNVWAQDAPMEEPMEDIPLQLPFNFLPYNDQPGLTEKWEYAINGDQVKINLEVNGYETASQPRPVQVRTVYIPDSVWQTLTKAGVETQDIAYESLVEKLEIKP